MMTYPTPNPASSLRFTSLYRALVTFVFLGSTCAAQAATVEDRAPEIAQNNAAAISGMCDHSSLCLTLTQYMQLAQQNDATAEVVPEQAPSHTPSENSPPGYPTILWEDTKHVLSAPTRWNEDEWENMGWATLSVLGVMAIVDRPVQDAMRRIAPASDPLSPNDNLFLFEVERFGREYSLALLGGFYVAGALNDDDTAVSVAQDGLTSVILASGVITTSMKIISGRARPREDLGTTDFNPFGGNDSFPSGHTAHAFAIASVISNHYDETWITYSSYGVASLVGLARSYHGGHFASDILAGGIIGTMVGKSVVEYNKPMRANNMVLMPEVSPGTVGIRVLSSF